MLSPTGNIKMITNEEFIKQIARPHSLEYELKVVKSSENIERYLTINAEGFMELYKEAEIF